jgi:hypothetical protein
MFGRQDEAAFDARVRRTASDDRPIRSAPEEKTDRGDEKRLSRSRFPGQGCATGAK